MIAHAAIAVTAIACAVSVAAANPVAPTYDGADLFRVQSRYPDGILGNFRDVIMPRLEASDAAALNNVNFEFPLTVDAAEPMAFYTAGDTIVMSAASLLFLDDLATAAAWLNENGYSQASVTDYASMLKYGRFGDAPPEPLEALCIPATALDDPGVDETATTAFEVAVIFVLLHELGHVLYRHPGYQGIDPDVARANEAQADRFALDGLARLDASPLAMINYFTVWAHMAQNAGDFASTAEFEAHLASRTHPLDSLRIASLVDDLRTDPVTESLAGPVLDQIVATLELPGVQEIMATVGGTGTEANLAPRRFGEMLGTPCGFVGDGQDFSGPYDGVMTINDEGFPVSLILTRNGSSVQGTTSFGVATYVIEGATDGVQLGYRWYVNDVAGRGVLGLGPDGALTGTWGSDGSEDNGGSIELHRRAVP
jgi:hypothetical protein